MTHCRYELALFDLDGTLLDTSSGIREALLHTLKGYGQKIPKASDLAAYIGPPIEVALRELLGIEGQALSDAAAQFRHRYRTCDLLKAEPYDGIFELLEQLRHHKVKTAVATYKREDYAKELLCHFGFDRHIPITHGSDNSGQLRKSDIIRRCVKEAGVQNPKKAVMIGDTLEDAHGAADAGVDFIAVTYGFGFHDPRDAQSSQAIGVASTPLDLLPYILKGE